MIIRNPSLPAPGALLLCALALGAARPAPATTPDLTHAAAAEIHGAGATFPAPVYRAWAADYARAAGVRVSYDAIGSGAGIERIRARQGDFGATDAPLAARELAAAGLAQFPAVIGGVVPVINIRGIGPGQLQLTGAVLADIYLGHIRRWNDTRIAALNPGVALPGVNITVVHRNDRSGSSLLWSDYLSRSSADWQRTAGASTLPSWPTGVGGAGNEGVASYVERTRFALGYVEYAFARAHHLSDVALVNASGQRVRAGRDSFRAAAESMDWTSDLTQQMATDLPGAGNWPVTGASFILVENTPQRAAPVHAVLQFFHWAEQHEAGATATLDYLPLPQAAVAQLPRQWQTLRDTSGRPLWP